jgi:hypothetical protein
MSTGGVSATPLGKVEMAEAHRAGPVTGAGAENSGDTMECR